MDRHRLHGMDHHHIFETHIEMKCEHMIEIFTTVFFEKAKFDAETDVTKYRDYVLKNGPDIDVPYQPKSNKKANEIRQAGNRLFAQREYRESLISYNESICMAENDSEDLAIGYANRSAVYYDLKEYELCLANIALAKRHKYPQRLMPKLDARELKCHECIGQGKSKQNQRHHRLIMNVEHDPRIPFLAKGIRMMENADWGRYMIAERDFKVGTVLLHEKPIITSVYPDYVYFHCNYCSSKNFFNLIPCPNCVSVMFCNNECLQKGIKSSHRFECGMREKLYVISHAKSRAYLGPKMFFYGLSLFEDNLSKMMEFCESHPRTGANPLTLDYKNYDPLEEFKVFHQTKLPAEKFADEALFRFYAAMYYSVFIRHPLVKSLFTNQRQKDFLLRSMLDYMRMVGFMRVNPLKNLTYQIFSIASVFNHSCDPNALTLCRTNKLKLVVLRPISKGEQIFISYGPMFIDHFNTERRQAANLLYFKCKCVVCDPVQRELWFKAGKKGKRIKTEELATLARVLNDGTADNSAQLNLLQQFVQKNYTAHPRKEYDMVLDRYRDMLQVVFDLESEIKTRGKVLSA